MFSIAGIILAVAAIAAIEVPPLWRKKWKKELAVFSALLLFGTVISIAVAVNAPIPNPVDWIIVAYKPLSEFMTSWLG